MKNAVLVLKYINCMFLNSEDMKLHYGDLTDSTCLVKIINEVKPNEIYNLGAQSHVKVSWEQWVSVDGDVSVYFLFNLPHI